MFTLNLNAISEPNPQAVICTFKEDKGCAKFESKEVPGKWLRVFPQTARDVSFLQMLEHRVDKLAPATGIGVLIAERVMPVRLTTA